MWREQAKALFFIDHLGINEIAIIVKRRRETVSRFLHTCEEYEKEIEFRKETGKKNRREYQRQWDRTNRAYVHKITGESLKREQELAAKILSREMIY